MQLKISHKYLIFSVNTYCQEKKVTFSDGETDVYDLMMRLDNISPNFFAYIDVSRFIGKTLTLKVSPEMELNFSESDEMNIGGLYGEYLRPEVHFTTRNGWINDPNGLIFVDGVYHLFYQYNPCEPFWGNMHWGHATSNDLINWEEKDITLFPDNSGTMFSGSAIIDENNLLKKQTDENPLILLFYTSTEPFCQNIAYSNDGLKTVKKYEGNPILPHLVAANRDPKVVFCNEINAYIMALFLEEDIYALFSSENLTDWKLIQKISLLGENECPDIFPISDSEGNKKWVLMGARDRYLVGEFKNGAFEPLQQIADLHSKSIDYAGQTFSNLPGGRVVRMTWENPKFDTMPFRGQMGIPMELKLFLENGRYYLTANPVKELRNLTKETITYKDFVISEEELSFDLGAACATLIEGGGEYKNSQVLTLECFGVSFVFHFIENALYVNKDNIAPISVSGDTFDFKIIIDRCSIEIFVDGGRRFSVLSEKKYLPDRNLNRLKIWALENTSMSYLDVYSLRSIWNR